MEDELTVGIDIRREDATDIRMGEPRDKLSINSYLGS
jgi:hypothetical protein